MSLSARKEYLLVIREKYYQARDKKEKTRLLDEYCKNTGQARKYVIRRIHEDLRLLKGKKKSRRSPYEGEVIAALIRVWEIFDYPCGQRLKPLLEQELPRLRKLGEVKISEEIARRLKQISPATIDRKLRKERERLQLQRNRRMPRPGSLLRSKIAVRLTEWDTHEVGYLEMDTVAHGGSSVLGEYVYSLSTTEIATGWWEGEAIMGKSQQATFWALKEIRKRTPFRWKGVDSDNGSEFMSEILYKYCDREKLQFTRSRANHKNDNAYIEQKNWTHVRKVLGYLRYDTAAEMQQINELYRQELRLYKNFFQPVMKLISKERIGGKIRRKYDLPRTPYQRLLESGQITEEERLKLEAIYHSLNPAELKRRIEAKLEKLWRTYEQKQTTGNVDPYRKQTPVSVTSLMIQRSPVGLPF
ncbi:MAG: hypothetical protein NUV31_09680 [Dehalococcoidales bacterium]|nr:hypothetical protein [Dehalococcoidales bacterium]